MKYVIVGGNPFTVYTGTTTFTALIPLGATDDPEEARQILRDNFDRCAGLLTAIDSTTGKIADLGDDVSFAGVPNT